MVALEQDTTRVMHYSGIPAGVKGGRESPDLYQPPIIKLHVGEEMNRVLVSEVISPWLWKEGFRISETKTTLLVTTL